MANDTSNVDIQLAAMAEQSAGNATEEDKARKSPYQNAYQTVIDLIDHVPTSADDETPAGLMQQWEKEETDENLRAAVLSFAGTLRDKIVSMRDTPRDPSQVVGRHYVGITSEGTRVHFKSASQPTEKSAVASAFKIVLGPFSTQGGAEYCVNKGRKAADTLVFHRAGTAKDLGARADYAAMVNAS